MTERFEHEQKLSQWYKSLEHPQPTAKLDNAILALAQQHAQETPPLETEKVSFLRRVNTLLGLSSWRRWQWPMGLVASAGCLFIIFFDHFQNFDPGILTPPIESAPRSVSTEAPLALEPQPESMSVESSEQADTQSEPVLAFKPAMTDYEAIAEQEAKQFSEQLQRSVEMTLQQEIDQQTLQDLDDVQTIDEATDLLAAAGVPEQQTEAIVVTGSRLEERAAAERELLTQLSQSERVDSSQVFLQQMLARHQGLLANKTNSQNLEIWQQQVTESQEDIFQYLRQLKLLNPNAQIESEYLDVLTEEQKQQLVGDNPQVDNP